MAKQAYEPVVLSDEDYARYTSLILARTGLTFGNRRRQALGRALVDAARNADCADLSQYYGRLISAPTDGSLWDELVKVLTVCETYFFRDPEHIEALQQRILPDIIERHRADHTLRIWSAGCATGEEPYTVAILLSQLLPDISRWKITILATDINRQALQQAVAGRYRQWSFRQTPSALRNAFFTAANDVYELLPKVRQLVTFAYLNLAEAGYPSPINYTSGLDLILCRNVMIYLPDPVIRDIAQRFFHSLAPDGWLIVGPSETHIDMYSQFQAVKASRSLAYRKSAAVPAPAPAMAAPDPLPHEHPAGALLLPPAAQPVPRSLPTPAPKPAPLRPTPPNPPGSAPPGALPGAPDIARQARALLKQGRASEARSAFLSCLAVDPEMASAQCGLARIEANAGHLAEAAEWAQRVLRSNPLDSEAYYTLALVCQEQGDLKQAVAQLKKAIYLDPGFVLAHFSLATLYGRLDRADEATRHRGLAIRLAARLAADDILPGSDDLTVGQMLAMTHTVL